MKTELGEKLRTLFAKGGYTCDGCNAEVFDYPANRLCADCENAVLKNDGKTCPKCGRKTRAEGVCLACKSDSPAFTRGFSPFVYEGFAASLINRFKNGERHFANFFGEAIVRTFSDLLAEDPDCVLTAVPMTEEKRKKRGYNQAAEIAKVAARETWLLFEEEILVKTRESDDQKNLSKKERAENLKGAYRVHKRTAVNGKRVFLFDDIMTTGATGSECARVLKNAGAKEVIFLTAVSVPERK